jgi:hypothetical protein
MIRVTVARAMRHYCFNVTRRAKKAFVLLCKENIDEADKQLIGTSGRNAGLYNGLLNF